MSVRGLPRIRPWTDLPPFRDRAERFFRAFTVRIAVHEDHIVARAAP
jgi:hypothetical protein